MSRFYPTNNGQALISGSTSVWTRYDLQWRMGGLGKAVDVRGDGDIMKKDGGGDGSKIYPALYINQL